MTALSDPTTESRGEPRPTGGVVASLVGARDRLSRPARPGVRKVMLGIVLVVFLGGAIWSFVALDLSIGDLKWAPLLLIALILAPLTAALNALEFSVSARILDRRIPFLDALRTALFATAANLLPLPGAALVRVGKLKHMGARIGGAVSSTVLMGLVWLGLALVIAGLAFVVRGSFPAGVMFLAGGAASLALSWLLFSRHVTEPERRLELAIAVVGVEILFVLVGAIRLFVVLVAIRAPVEPSQALVLNVSGALAATVGIFPAGLGLREGIAAALAPLVGLKPAYGFFSGALNRVLGMAGNSLISVFLLGRRDEE
jgi:hypothetical protein